MRKKEDRWNYEPNQVKLLIAAPPCLYNYDAVNVLYNRSQIHSSKPPLV